GERLLAPELFDTCQQNLAALAIHSLCESGFVKFSVDPVKVILCIRFLLIRRDVGLG
ncbi:hypothetical protein MPH_14178, partial [Macrophomina phaseolina MS6]